MRQDIKKPKALASKVTALSILIERPMKMRKRSHALNKGRKRQHHHFNKLRENTHPFEVNPLDESVA